MQTLCMSLPIATASSAIVSRTPSRTRKAGERVGEGSEGSAASQFAKALASPLSELAKLVAGEWAGHKLKDQIAEADAPVGKLLDALTDYVAITGAQVKSLEGLERECSRLLSSRWLTKPPEGSHRPLSGR